MASIAFPSLSKKATLSDGVTYGYVASAPSAPNKPTFLLLHGYPSSSYDWRNQVASLSAAGFGVIAPDLLGYGETDSPADLEAYRMKTMSQHMAEILDVEGVSRCVGVSHDWGSGLLSRLATYIPERLFGAVFVSVGYVEPGLVWDIEALLCLTKEAFGYETYGYWPWHNSEEAVKDCNEHPASVFSLIYPKNPADWKVNFAPLGAARDYVRSGKVDPLPPWYDLAEYTTRHEILSLKGYRGPLNWYKAAMQGVNLPDEADVSEEDKFCKVPTLFVGSDLDYVTRADMQQQNTSKWAKQLRVEIVQDCGHWVQLERPDELHRFLEGFASEVIDNGTPGLYSVRPDLAKGHYLMKPGVVIQHYTIWYHHFDRFREREAEASVWAPPENRPFDFIVPSAWNSTAGPIGEEAIYEAEEGNATDVDSTTESSSPRTSLTRAESEISANSVHNEMSTSATSSLAHSASPSAVPNTAPLPLNGEVAHLLSVYSTGLATWMDIFDHTRSYQLEVPRRCLTSALLVKCVCAFTAKQLSLAPSGDVWSVPAARYYGDALRLLIQHLDSSPGSTHGDALTANMLLSSYEMLEDHSHEHQRHLYGASTLIRMQGINARSRGMDRANFWVYVRHEVTIALEHETPLQLSPEAWNAEWRAEHGEEDALGNQLIWIVARAVDRIYAPGPSSSKSSLEHIRGEGAAWFNNLPVSFQGVKHGHADDLGFVKTYYAVPAAAAAMLWYHLLILLCAEAAPHDSSEIQYHAAEVANIALSEIPPGVRGFSAPPLFYAAKHIKGIGKKTRLWALLGDLEIRYGLKTRHRVQKLQQLAECTPA